MSGREGERGGRWPSRSEVGKVGNGNAAMKCFGTDFLGTLSQA